MTENEQFKEYKIKPSQIGVKVLIFNSRDEVLLLKRNPEVYGDGEAYWDIPGGRVEKNIDIASIIGGGALHPELCRELREEIGWLPTGNETLRFIARQQVTTSMNEKVDRYTVAMRIVDDIPVRLSNEHTAYKWIPADELKNTENLGHALKSLVSENNIK